MMSAPERFITTTRAGDTTSVDLALIETADQ
jgi:hypothetical protein